MNGVAILFALVAMLAWGVWGILADHALMDKGISGVLFFTYLTALLAVVGFDSGVVSDPSVDGLLPAVGAGIALAVGSFFFYKALELGQLSVVPAVAGLYFIVPAVYGVFVLEESLSAVNVAGIVLACLAIVLLSQ